MASSAYPIVRPPAIAELFDWNDWARDKLLEAARTLTDAQLDQPFEMGEGSLRATLHHLWAAERVWLDRWTPGREVVYHAKPNGVSIAELGERFASAARERNALVAAQTTETLARTFSFTNRRGEAFTMPCGPLMLHVCNHGAHHRAQATNMLRRLGGAVPKPGLDYIFFRLERPEPAPAIDLDTVRAYFAYADWSRGVVHAIAAGLRDDQLDRPFEIGLGTLRRTLLHIRFAEQWWFENWTLGPGRPFPELNEATTMADLGRLANETAASRSAFIAGLSDADLARTVTAIPRPGVTRVFPLGVTMLQLCGHGTLHRAQAANMLRHVGAEVPRLDYFMMLRGL